MRAFIATVTLAAAVLAASPSEAQSLRYGDPTTLVGPGSTIGVQVRELTNDEARASAGVYIEQVVAGTPAERAGFKPGDIVVEFDGERVRSVRGFTRLVSETPPRRTVKAVILREGSRRTLDVEPEVRRAAGLPQRPLLELFQRGRELEIPVPPFSQGTPRYRGWIGVTLEPVTGQLADYFGVSAGVLVSAVELDSPASRAGLKAGDVITTAAGQAVRRPVDVTDAMRRTRPGSKLELKVVRDRKELTMTVDLTSPQPVLL